MEGALWRQGLVTWPERKHQLRVGQLQQKKAVSGTQADQQRVTKAPSDTRGQAQEEKEAQSLKAGQGGVGCVCLGY